MATKEEDNLNRAEVQALITDTVTDIVGKVFARSREDTDKTVNGAVARLTETISGIAKQLESVQQLSAKVESTDSRLSEIFTALQASDEDTDQPNTPQAVDTEAMTAKIKEEIAKEYLERIQGLEKVVETERQEKDKIKQERIEGDRDNAVIESLKKVAPKLNLFPNLETVIKDHLAKEKVLQVSEDGTSWMARVTREDPYIKGKIIEEIVPASEDILESIIAQNYSVYQQPRAGVSPAAFATQAYSPTNRKITDNTTAADIQNIISSGDKAGLDEIAALIAQGA